MKQRGYHNQALLEPCNQDLKVGPNASQTDIIFKSNISTKRSVRRRPQTTKRIVSSNAKFSNTQSNFGLKKDSSMLTSIQQMTHGGNIYVNEAALLRTQQNMADSANKKREVSELQQDPEVREGEEPTTVNKYAHLSDLSSNGQNLLAGITSQQ